MLTKLHDRWRPLRRRLKRRLGLGEYSSATRREREREACASLDTLRSWLESGAPAGSFVDHELRVHSQNGEDGLLAYIFSIIGTTDRRLVEFGIEDGRECLSRTLLEHLGWSGLLMDCVPENVADARGLYRKELGLGEDRARIVQSLVTAENIDRTLQQQGFAGDLDLLSIDIDGNDYWVWKAIEAARPRVVAIEYNASFGPDEKLTIPYDPDFERKAAHRSGCYHGASLAALAALGDRKGYALVGADSSGINAFFVRRDVLREPLIETTAAASWRPHRSRSRRRSPADQLALLKTLPLSRGE